MKQTEWMMPGVLISFYSPTLTQEEKHLVLRLVTDLSSFRFQVFIDEVNDLRIGVSPQAMDQYQWILLIQPSDAEDAKQMETRVEAAPSLPDRQRPRGILHVLVSSAPIQTLAFGPTMYPTFDASKDYPRALASIVLTINPHQENLYGVKRWAAPPLSPSSPHSNTPFFSTTRDMGRYYRLFKNTHKKPVGWLIVLSAILVLGIIVTSFIIGPLNRIESHNGKATGSPHGGSNPSQVIYRQATSGTPTIDDTLQAKSGNNWEIVTLGRRTCTFGSDHAYHVKAISSGLPDQYVRTICLANMRTFGNFAFQVDMRLRQGSVGGIIFRAKGQSIYYWFSLDTKGCYELVFSPPSTDPQVLSPQVSNCLPFNMHESKQLTVIAHGNNIYLYVDGQFISHVLDMHLTVGQVGMLGIDRPDNPTQVTEVEFMNVKIWQL